ncbi:NADP-dependent oxidoreductase domain-containing protein [Kalaharituber pfeilii]|nr:NADP-dependent oxidoreductase domain-containing protein [Kalaharituber pfeilii]
MAPEALSLTARYTLLSSSYSPKTQIPALGLGVLWSSADKCPDTIETAIEYGYRHIDTAQYYENEAEVGEGVRQSGVPREEIFITTKLLFPSPKQSYEETLETVLHSPSPGAAARKMMWQVLEKLQDEGGTREIGISNFYARYTPVVNQIELHPWCPQPGLVEFCKEKNILLQAYTPLIHGRKLDDPTIVEIARVHNVTPAQVLIRWSLQKGFTPLPKSDTPAIIQENASVYHFDLTIEEMAKIHALGEDLEDGQGALCPYNVHCP